MSKRYSVTEIPNLNGRVTIVTGGNGGIGLEITRQLASHGARVYMASRNKDKAEQAMKEMQDAHDKQRREGTGNSNAAMSTVDKLDVRFLELDLMSIEAAKRAARDFLSKEQRLDTLVCNAGVMAPSYKLTDDGIEQSFQTNHLSHFALFQLLAPTMVSTAKQTGRPSRLVNLSSIAHTFVRFNPLLTFDFTSLDAVNRRMGFDQIGRYMRYSQSKLSALLFAREVNKRFAADELRATAVHPGFVASNLYSKTPLAPIAPLLFIKVADGALAPLYAATSTEIEEKDGWNDYYATYGIKTKDSVDSHNETFMKDLWKLSEELTKTDTNETKAAVVEAKKDAEQA